MTVMSRPCRWCAACSVVVPMSIITVWPSSHQPGRRRADAVLRLEALDRRLGERALGAGVDRAAAHPLDLPLAGERAQVAADRHLRDPEAPGQLGHVRRARAHRAQDRLPALGRELVPRGRHRPACRLDAEPGRPAGRRDPQLTFWPRLIRCLLRTVTDTLPRPLRVTALRLPASRARTVMPRLRLRPPAGPCSGPLRRRQPALRGEHVAGLPGGLGGPGVPAHARASADRAA